ncbi:MAG: protein regulator of cytokinesis family protein [Actinomycetota bacterium]|jgi:hypothetical protein|nr:protein regulator of cytokinesis family protein [Actinomycetota bacterium]
MAKAIFGHVGLGPDVRLVAELRSLRGRVAALEAEVARLREVNEALVDAVADSSALEHDVATLSQPAYS